MKQPNTHAGTAYPAQPLPMSRQQNAADAPASTGLPPISMRPRMTLHTLTRGDGLLGMRSAGRFGPRGASVTVVQIDWLYRDQVGGAWTIPAPATLMNRRPGTARFLEDDAGRRVGMRDLAAEADALDRVWDLALCPLPPECLQWRSDDASALQMSHASIPQGPLWTLVQEDQFDDFWADVLPGLQDDGWIVVVRPGFSHESVTVDAWHLSVSPVTGEVTGKTAAARIGVRTSVAAGLQLPVDSGSWMISLGIEIDGETLDLVPMLAHLVRVDARWRDAAAVAAIDDAATILLRAPGGKRIATPCAPLKAIVSHLLELLTDPGRTAGPLPLSSWDANRIEAVARALQASQATRAGVHGTWQLQGAAGLRALAHRLHDSLPLPCVCQPDGLGVTLRPYQLQGLAWLQYLRAHHLSGILADDMGLGKTAQALAHILVEQQAGRLDCPALVVLPTSLVFNWEAEARRMVPGLRVLSLQGPQRSAGFAHMNAYDLVLTTYAVLWRDISVLAAQPFHLLILDEAQSVKNPGGRSAAAVRRLRARHRLCLTGTPVENHLGELWTQFDFLMPGLLGDARSFARLWRTPIELHGETLRAQLLAQRVRPFILRRRKDEVATELPPRIDIVRRLSLVNAQRALYESVRVAADAQVRKVLERKGFTGGHVSILDALLKLRQVCCDPFLLKGVTLSRHIERAKIELLRTMMPALVQEGRRILVFSQFTEMLALIETELAALDIGWLSLTGQTPAARRGAVVAQFQTKTVPVLLISLKAGGVGLNLTAADTVIHVDPWWNPAVEEQANARAHRIGQEQTVVVYKLVIEGSIEERILTLQARKADLAEQVLGSDGPVADKFNAEDLQAMLAPLRPVNALLTETTFPDPADR